MGLRLGEGEIAGGAGSAATGNVVWRVRRGIRHRSSVPRTRVSIARRYAYTGQYPRADIENRVVLPYALVNTAVDRAVFPWPRIPRTVLSPAIGTAGRRRFRGFHFRSAGRIHGGHPAHVPPR